MNNLKKIKSLFDQEYYYLKCKTAFQDCISNKENDFLKEEIETPINDLVLHNDQITLLFKSENNDDFIIDIKIKLINSDLNKQIGYYKYQENMEGEYLDEFLVFF